MRFVEKMGSDIVCSSRDYPRVNEDEVKFMPRGPIFLFLAGGYCTVPKLTQPQLLGQTASA